MGNGSMNGIFHSIVKSVPNVIIYHSELVISKPISCWSEIDDLCSKISWMRGVGWSDELFSRFSSGLDHFNTECFFSSIPSNLWI